VNGTINKNRLMIYKDTYRDWHSNSIRGILRNSALNILYKYHLYYHDLQETLDSTNRIQFLCLHHLFKDEETSFIKLIKKLKKKYVFLSYSEAIERLKKGNIENKYIVFSFDDGIKNTLKAAEILDSYNISACFFVPTIFLDETNQTIKDNFCVQQLHVQPVELFNWQDLEKLKKLGHEIGAHTHTHPNISKISDNELLDELSISNKLLTENLGQIIHFAWPFGHFDDIRSNQIKIVESFNWSSIASAERGCHCSKNDGFSSKTIFRDPFVALWAPEHLDYFMYKNLQKRTCL
jgi:peptidoglycan/xylan/chitin deacetylase (PgdA/CDA1 family)